MDEDYGYDFVNYGFDEESEYYCEECGEVGAALYNSAGQRLSMGGFDTDKLLCDICHEEIFRNR